MNLSINKPTVVIESNGKIVFKQKCKLSKCRIIAHSFITNNLCVDEIINASPTNPLKGSYIELYSDMIDEAIAFYQTVKQEIINYK